MSGDTKEIVLTGGPCAGKTTGKNYVAEKLRERGVRVLSVPEVATMFIAGGIDDISEIERHNPYVYLEIEKQMLLFQMEMAERFRSLASRLTDGKKLVLYDRGPMDVKAYLPEGYFDAMLQEHSLTLRDCRDRFNAVFHLVTAADGAEMFYSTENNAARREVDLEDARKADRAVLGSWLGHPHLKIVDNSTDFEGKLKRLLSGITRVLGMPVPLEVERKFLLASRPEFRREPLLSAQRISVEQMYLRSGHGEETRIRRWGQGSSVIYYTTHKKNLREGVRQETEAEISTTQYLSLQSLRDSSARIIRKDRYCFIWHNQYFELDVFLEPRRGLCLLEIELTEDNASVDLPPFLDIKEEVTGNPAYSNYTIARS